MTELEQTDTVKIQLYQLVEQFVKKYARQYYKAFKGDPEDLVGEIYADFLTKKGRGEKKESLLDKYDSNVTSLPYLVKQSVIRKLIDYSRKDKGEVSYDQIKGSDDEDNLNAAEYFGNKAGLSSSNFGGNEFDYDDTTVRQAQSMFSRLSDDDKYAKIVWFNANKDDLDPTYVAFFKKVFKPNHTLSELQDKGVGIVLEFESWKKSHPVWKLFGAYKSTMSSAQDGFGVKVYIKDPFPTTASKQSHPNAVRVFNAKKDLAKSRVNPTQIDELNLFMDKLGWGPVTGWTKKSVKNADGTIAEERVRTKAIHNLNKLIFYFERYE